MDKLKLTQKEEAVLGVLWRAATPLTISQICEVADAAGDSLNQSTVQLTVKNLLAKELVKVGEIVQANKVLARAFQPTMTPDEFAVARFRQMMSKNGKKKITNVVAALLDQEKVTDEELDELSDIIKGMQKQ